MKFPKIPVFHGVFQGAPRTLQKCSILMGDKSGEVRKRKAMRYLIARRFGVSLFWKGTFLLLLDSFSRVIVHH